MPRANLTRPVVLSAAAELADRDGFDAISISELARHFGVKPASLYSHVRDRGAVIEGVHEIALDELADRVAAAIGGRSATDALIGFGEAHRRYAEQRPGCWTALQRPASPSTMASAAAQRMGAQLVAVIRGYELPEPEIVHAARLVGATINGFLTLERVGSFGNRDEDTEASWARALSALDVALSAWPTQTVRPTEMEERA